MVDSIRQSGRIGVITPPGPSRRLKQRRQPGQEPRDSGEEESPQMDDETLPDEDAQRQQAPASENGSISSSNKHGNIRTGRHIDVRI
jgi:hypothetical protein